MIPRHKWLYDRINEVLIELNESGKSNKCKERFIIYIENVNKMAKELLYLTEEWHKYYVEEK